MGSLQTENWAANKEGCGRRLASVHACTSAAPRHTGNPQRPPLPPLPPLPPEKP
jgi:hypothetical protein